MLSRKELLYVGVLAGVMFFRMLGVFVVLPVASLAAAALPDGHIGWAMGLAVGGYGITQALMQIPTGLMADRWGKKPVLIGALLVFAGGGFIAAAADTVWTLVAGRLLQGGGAVATVAAAWIADVTAPKHRAQAMLIYGAAIALAFGMSLPLAPLLSGWLGMSGIFAMAGWLGVAAAAAAAFLPSPPPLRHTVTTGSIAAVWPYAAGAFVTHYAFSALFLQLPMTLNDFLPLTEHWRVYAPTLLLAAILGVPMVIKKYRLAPLLAGFFLIVGTLITENTWWTATSGLTMFFAGFIIMEAIIPAHASRAAPESRRSAAIGVVMTAAFGGMFAGATVSGTLNDIVDQAVAQWLVVLLVFAWFAIILRKL